MSTKLKALMIAGSTAALMAGGVEAAEYQCRQDDSTLRIAVEVKKAGHTLPCEVIAEDDRGERAVLYRAQYDREYCPSRIERTRGELEAKGWRCEKTSDENIVMTDGIAVEDETEPQTEAVSVQAEDAPGRGGALIADNGKAITASRQCRNGDDIRVIRIEVENPDRGRPCELIYWADGNQSRPGELLWRAEHDATFCPTRLDTIIEKWSADGWQCDADAVQSAAVQPPAEPVRQDAQPEAGHQLTEPSEPEPAELGAPAVSDPDLEAIVTADAERIGQWMDVKPDIDIAARGDLNEDGADDAVVFLAYQSDRAAYRQYLMSYLGAEQGYELVSVKLLTGVSPPPAQARVDQIDKGVIWLTLPGEEGSSPTQTGYKLRDQQLVEVPPEPSDPSN